MGRRGYLPEFRRRVLALIDAGRKVRDVARDLGISEQTAYVWRKQHRIDQGLEPVRPAANAPSSQPTAGESSSWRPSSRSSSSR
jgi:transposase-like protein